jgi:multisubunit Na+/H+ antiporter MnhG subunit
MTTGNPETATFNNRGAIFRIFGAIFIILGTLDTMLSWRGGFEVITFHTFLIATGLLLCGIGAVLRHKSALQSESSLR